MNDSQYMKILDDLINENEGKLQEAAKNNNARNEIENIKTVLKYLREKKKELNNKK